MMALGEVPAPLKPLRPLSPVPVTVLTPLTVMRSLPVGVNAGSFESSSDPSKAPLFNAFSDARTAFRRCSMRSPSTRFRIPATPLCGTIKRSDFR